MAKVQRVPRSLLALAGIVGENPPQSLSDFYQATIDVSGLIIAELNVEQGFTVNAASVAGSTAVLTVPAGEVWFLEGATALVQNVAATVNNAISVGIGNQAQAMFYAVLGATVPAIVRNDTVVKTFEPPYVLSAGQTVSARLDATDAAGNQLMIVLATFRRIRV